MLKLRTVLLSNYLYIVILILVLLISLIRINLNQENNINIKESIILDQVIDGNKLSLTLKSNNKYIDNYYFKSKKELNYAV